MATTTSDPYTYQSDLDTSSLAADFSIMSDATSSSAAASSAAASTASAALVTSVASSVSFGISAVSSRSQLESNTLTNSPSSSTAPATTSSVSRHDSSEHSSSGLSTSAKVGTEIAIPLIVIITAICLFIYFRRQRQVEKMLSLSSSDLPSTCSVQDNSELSGRVYDPIIAGITKPRFELPGTLSTNMPRAHASTGHLPLELGYTPVVSEIGSAELAGGGGGVGASSKMADAIKPGGGAGAASTTGGDSSSAIGAPASVTGSMIRNSASRLTDDDAGALAEEADLLVQELGLIQMRKRALAGVAKGQGVKPENLPGVRGEDYRELLAREARVRGRIDEIDSARTVTASQL